MISAELVPVLAERGLTVVTQPGFVAERGDRYLLDVPPEEHADLYRCASLLDAGVPVAGSTDAPYTSPDPWLAIRAAVGIRAAKNRRRRQRLRLAPSVHLPSNRRAVVHRRRDAGVIATRRRA